MTPSFSIERRQAAEVVSWIRDRIPEQRETREREGVKEKKEKKFPPSPSPRRRGRFPRVTYHGALYDISSAASPPLSLCHSLRSPFDGKDHARAQNDGLHARSRAHTHRECVCARE